MPIESTLQVPKEWSNLKRARAGGVKGRDTVKKRFKSEMVLSNNSADSVDDICRSICDNIGRCEDLDHELDFSDVLSHIDYRGVLEGLFGGRGIGADVPVVARAYEESFMREPMGGERKCVMGTSCEAMVIDKFKPFIAVEFQLPGKTTETPQMCVLCSRKHTQRLFYDFLYRATPASCTGVIQRYGVMCDAPGEYTKDACLIMPPHGPVHCMPYPSVAYQRSHFTVQTHCMSHFIKQTASASGIVIGPLKRVVASGVLLGGESDDIPARVEALHARLKDDYSVRWELDRYLLATHFYPAGPPKWMVLDTCDTYHYYNLPDLVHIVRSTLMGQCCSPWLQRLFNMFLCGKRYRRLVTTSDQHCQLTAAVINTLHGLLLGLYPFNERRSTFAKRAWIAGTMHGVLTQGKHMDFILAHPHLLCLSLVEYILNVVHDFCPVEWSLLGVSTGAKSQCLAAVECFRENTVNVHAQTDDFWARTEADAIPVVTVLSKFFRDTTLYQHRSKGVLPAAMLPHLSLALRTQVIQNSSSIFGQLKCALPGIQFRESEALEEIWTSVYIRALPSHTTGGQMAALDRLGKMCFMVERELHHLPMCLACALTRRADVLKSLFRFDTVEMRLVCNECMRHQSVVSINMLGRVLFVRDKVIVLCEHCLRPKYWDSACACLQTDANSADTCCVCNTQNIVSSKQVVDLRALRMKTVHFCYKHSLSCVINDATVYDVHALEQELRHRALKPS